MAMLNKISISDRTTLLEKGLTQNTNEKLKRFIAKLINLNIIEESKK